MASWSTGHAVRRRAGGSSSYTLTAGSGGRVSLPTPEEAIAGMARVGSPRVPMGNSAIETGSARPVLTGTQVPRGNTQSQDPALVPGITGRNAIINENLGAQHMVSVSTPPMTDPSAGATQTNGHVVASAIPRKESFYDGSSGAVAGY